MNAQAITYKEIRGLFSGGRSRLAHKGDFGRVLIIAGSCGMAGAAILCAQGALRAGCGLAALSVPEELLPIVQTAVPEAICLGRSYAAGAPLEPEKLSAYDAIAIGPGLGTQAEAEELLSHILKAYHGKLVLDADALNLLALQKTASRLPQNTILTPHAGEAARLLGLDTKIQLAQSDRETAALALAQRYGCTAVLKGAGTLIAAPTGGKNHLFFNTTGNPGMATGGSGDVLAGVICAFLAQGMDTQTAACAGVYVHGLAGDLAAQELGEYGLTAGDLPLAVAYAIKHLGENAQRRHL